MKIFKRIAAVFMVAAIAFSMAACGSSFTKDVATLVQGNIDELYLGQYNEDYIKLVNTTRAECEQDYLDGIKAEAEFFVYYYNIEYTTDELMAEIQEMYKEIYSHSSYIVNEPSKLDDNTYALKVQIKPINIIQLVDEYWDEGMAAFYDKYEDADLEAMTEEEYMQFDSDWAHAILEMFYDQMPNIGYMDEESIAIQVTKGSDDVWKIADSDMGKIDELMIYYT